MKIHVDTGYLDPIVLGDHEWVEVLLPSGLRVTVFDDKVFVSTEEDRIARRDGEQVWARG